MPGNYILWTKKEMQEPLRPHSTQTGFCLQIRPCCSFRETWEKQGSQSTMRRATLKKWRQSVVNDTKGNHIICEIWEKSIFALISEESVSDSSEVIKNTWWHCERPEVDTRPLWIQGIPLYLQQAWPTQLSPSQASYQRYRMAIPEQDAWQQGAETDQRIS